MSLYRVRSDLWFNLPGVVAAYQPIMAPGPLLARNNIGNEKRFAGRFTATVGTAEPTWAAHTGWTCLAASTQNYITGVVPSGAGWTLAGCWSSMSVGNHGGYNGSTTNRFYIGYNLVGYGSANKGLTNLATGVRVLAGTNAYLNGVLEAATGTTWGAGVGANLYLGGRNMTGYVESYVSGNIRAFAIYARTLSPAEIFAISRQMAYCNQNPDWSAWSRQRKWYYGQAAGFLPAWAAYSNQQIGVN